MIPAKPLLDAAFWARVEAWAARKRLIAAFKVSKCSAHGRIACALCHRNPSNCVTAYGGCAVYAEDGVHWDSCPNRVR
jgi:hypothetical protein